MDKQSIASAANRLVLAFGEGAHGAIGAWREGGERLGRIASKRWDTAFAQSRAQLSAQTRRNATNTRNVVARYYGQGLSLTAAGATVAVDTVVQAAQAAPQQRARA